MDDDRIGLSELPSFDEVLEAKRCADRVAFVKQVLKAPETSSLPQVKVGTEEEDSIRCHPSLSKPNKFCPLPDPLGAIINTFH